MQSPLQLRWLPALSADHTGMRYGLPGINASNVGSSEAQHCLELRKLSAQGVCPAACQKIALLAHKGVYHHLCSSTEPQMQACHSTEEMRCSIVQQLLGMCGVGALADSSSSARWSAGLPWILRVQICRGSRAQRCSYVCWKAHSHWSRSGECSVPGWSTRSGPARPSPEKPLAAGCRPHLPPRPSGRPPRVSAGRRRG